MNIIPRFIKSRVPDGFFLVTKPAILKELNKVKRELQNLRRTYKWVTDGGVDSNYSGNRYKSYEDALDNLSAKYGGEASWGVLLVGNIVDIRAALITGSGLEITPKAKIKNKRGAESFRAEFEIANDLKGSYPTSCAVESELEGKQLYHLFWDSSYKWKTDPLRVGMVKVRLDTHKKAPYRIVAHQSDYMRYSKAVFNDKDIKDLDEPNFVYRKLGGRIDEPNKPVMKMWRVLTSLENLDMALTDLRIIDFIYAGPVADVQCDTPAQVDEVADNMATNFVKRKFFIHVGTFNYKSPPIAGTEILIKEAALLAKVIAGTTGVPVHYLGFVDEMSNRATAETLVDSLNASITIERTVAESAWGEVVEKAIAIYNVKSGQEPFSPNSFDVKIKIITPDQWERLNTTFIPGFEKKVYSLRTVLENTPGVDVEEELKRVQEEADKRMETFNQISANFESKEDKEGEDEDEEENKDKSKPKPDTKEE